MIQSKVAPIRNGARAEGKRATSQTSTARRLRARERRLPSREARYKLDRVAAEDGGYMAANVILWSQR